LTAGGTFFRSRDPGLQAAKISVQVVEVRGPTDASPLAACVVTNYNLSFSENVEGNVTVNLLDLNLKAGEYIVIDQLDTPTPRARSANSISAQIAHAAPTLTDVGTFSFSKLFTIPGKLAVKLTPGQSVFTSTDVITIRPRIRIYPLEVLTVTDATTGTSSTGWDIDKLRALINANDPWIQMTNRQPKPAADPGGAATPDPVNEDFQDVGFDEPVLLPFDEQRLKGGDGLPADPNAESTGPTRSIVHINYGEDVQGRLQELTQVYEWDGDSSSIGAWKIYT
jgi:hypothetical protein